MTRMCDLALDIRGLSRAGILPVVRRLKEELNLDWDSKFSDLNLDSILNLVLLPKNFKMENHENHAPRAIARIKCRNSCTGTMMQLHGTCQLNL